MVDSLGNIKCCHAILEKNILMYIKDDKISHREREKKKKKRLKPNLTSSLMSSLAPPLISISINSKSLFWIAMKIAVHPEVCTHNEQ